MNTRQQIFDTVYKEGSATTPVNPQDVRPQPETKMPEGTLHLPVFYDTLKTLDQTVDVDYYLPGCPPEAENIWKAIVAILEGKLPPKGSVIGVNTTVCDECKRKRNEKKIKKFYRTWQIIPDEETCLLEQGLLVLRHRHPRRLQGPLPAGQFALHRLPRRPTNGVADYGARLMSAVASVIDSNDPDEIDKIISEGIPDPMGSFYRFSLASSQLRRKKKGLQSRRGNRRLQMFTADGTLARCVNDATISIIRSPARMSTCKIDFPRRAERRSNADGKCPPRGLRQSRREPKMLNHETYFHRPHHAA